MSDTKLWTFVADFKGGTYIAQERGESLGQALVTYAESNTMWDIPPQDLKDVVAVKGLEEVWCFDSLIGDDLLLIHVIGSR